MKIVPEVAAKIRRLHTEEGLSERILTIRFGIDRKTIHRILLDLPSHPHYIRRRGNEARGT